MGSPSSSDKPKVKIKVSNIKISKKPSIAKKGSGKEMSAEEVADMIEGDGTDPGDKGIHPLAGIKYTENAEQDSELELNAVAAALRNSDKYFKQLFEDENGVEYYDVIIFPSGEHQREFRAHMSRLGIKFVREFIHGMEFAKKLGIELKTPDIPPRSYRRSSRFKELAMKE